MERLMKCLRLELSRTLRNAAIFTCFYIGFCILFIVTSLFLPKNGYVNYYYFTTAAIYALIIVTLLCRIFFQTLLQFSNTRGTIFGAHALNFTLLSALLALLSVLSDRLNPWLAARLNFRTSVYMAILYPGASQTSAAGFFEWLLFYFSVLAVLSSLALLYGSLLYKFGKWFAMFFWMIFGSLCGLATTLLIELCGTQLAAALKGFFAYGQKDGIVLASLHLLPAAVVFGALAWLLMRRQEQKTGDA